MLVFDHNNRHVRYAFDRVFDPQATNREIFDECVKKDVLDAGGLQLLRLRLRSHGRRQDLHHARNQRQSRHYMQDGERVIYANRTTGGRGGDQSGGDLRRDIQRGNQRPDQRRRGAAEPPFEDFGGRKRRRAAAAETNRDAAEKTRDAAELELRAENDRLGRVVAALRDQIREEKGRDDDDEALDSGSPHLAPEDAAAVAGAAALGPPPPFDLPEVEVQLDLPLDLQQVKEEPSKESKPSKPSKPSKERKGKVAPCRTCGFIGSVKNMSRHRLAVCERNV